MQKATGECKGKDIFGGFEQWDQEKDMELSSESVIPETGKECPIRVESEPEARAIEILILRCRLGEGKQGTRLCEGEEDQNQVHDQFTAKRVGSVGQPRGRGQRARGLTTDTSKERAYGIRIIDNDEAVVQTTKRRQLVDEESDVIIAVSAGNYESPSMELSGVRSPSTVRSLDELVKALHPSLLFISKTKRSARRCDFLRNKWNYFGMGVDTIGKSGGLMKRKLEFTGFYGPPDAAKRKESWELLHSLSKQSVRPWLCSGDYNEILTQAEKQGQLARPEWQMEGFRGCLEECQLVDMGFEGDKFTWSNHREHPHTVRARLDRACCTTNWMSLFLHAQVKSVAIGGQITVSFIFILILAENKDLLDPRNNSDLKQHGCENQAARRPLNLVGG
ncbi:UNVERIFIED_CONTAM: hypothetical protein Slati_1683100 [Sesamum latifolium]|uniref:Uncharacterized protein n=1 Tax=Sesamum latifolium TaxID=2727402 RepID=A0AAW2WUT8_9LAMI